MRNTHVSSPGSDACVLVRRRNSSLIRSSAHQAVLHQPAVLFLDEPTIGIECRQYRLESAFVACAGVAESPGRFRRASAER
jgi:hypothetical protein